MTEEVTTAEVYRTLVDFRDEVRVERADERQRAKTLAEELAVFQTEIRKAVFIGNGTPGLVSRMTAVEEWKKNISRGASVIVGALVGWMLGPK